MIFHVASFLIGEPSLYLGSRRRGSKEKKDKKHSFSDSAALDSEKFEYIYIYVWCVGADCFLFLNGAG